MCTSVLWGSLPPCRVTSSSWRNSSDRLGSVAPIIRGRYNSATPHVRSSVVVEIGDVPVGLNTTDTSLIKLLEKRFGRFLSPDRIPAFTFDINVVSDGTFDPDADLQVRGANGRWTLRRGDFLAEWDARQRHGWIRQTLNPYAIDSVLRIVHSLVLATEGGFLLHASSAVRDGQAFLFTGPSGSGKTR